MLECRVSPTLAAKLTGNAVKQGYNECFTTLDLMTLDLITGKAQLLKSGAACSYLLRNGEPKHLSAPSLPLGIAYETIPESIEFVMQSGDVLIMISDGMADTEEDEYKLAERIGLLTETEPQKIAERLLAAAIADAERSRKNKRCDDMTVSVIRLSHTNGSLS